MQTSMAWHVEHVHFERLLDYLEGQLSAIHIGESPHYALMLDVVNFLSHFGARYHHAREEVAFEHIVRHNPGMSTKISKLQQEHSIIKAKGDGLCGLLSKVLVGDPIDRAVLEATLTTYISYYRNHLVSEEQNILPYAEEMLSTAEWTSVGNAGPRGPEPFMAHDPRRHNPTFGNEAEARFLQLQRRIVHESASSGERGFVRQLTHAKDTALSQFKSGSFLALPASANVASKNVTTPRLLVRRAVMWFALAFAYLYYYFMDVHLQIQCLPLITVYLYR